MREGNREWREVLPLPLDQEASDLRIVEGLDDFLASDAPLQSLERLLQGPIVDRSRTRDS